MDYYISKVSMERELQNCFAIRKQVFVLGQNVPLEEELDGKDHESDHYLLTVDFQPVGTARVRFVSDYAKIERVAILEQWQNKGLGKKLMRAIISDLQRQAVIKEARLGAQTHAISFYERLGFTVYGEEYQDAGIPHKDMYLALACSLTDEEKYNKQNT